MPDNTLENGQVTNAAANEEKTLPAGNRGHSIVIKALKTNVGVAYIGATGKAKAASEGFPLAAGESITVDVKNAQNIRYSFDTANDKLAWLVTGP